MKHDNHTAYLPTDAPTTGETESFVWKAYQSRSTAVHTIALISLGFICWNVAHAFFPQSVPDTVHFLDVGQGDAALITLAPPEKQQEPVRILVDGGRDGRVLEALSDIQREGSFGYIDLVILSHQDLDHFGGLAQVLEQYAIGAFISNGKQTDGERWRDLVARIEAKNIPHHMLGEADTISFNNRIIEILLPTEELHAKENINEASLVFSLSTPHNTGTTTVLFTGDIGHPAERALLEKEIPLRADILKVGHHGSKHSSSDAFIHAVAPSISIISVGKNSYGHPAPEVLSSLERAGSIIYTTQEHATIRIPLNPETLAKAAAPKRSFLASVFWGTRFSETGTTLTLLDAQAQKGEMSLVPITTCSFDTPQGSAPQNVWIHEVAWMGSPAESTHEWIELMRISDAPVDISGWQILNENGRVHATFPQGTTLTDTFAIAARKNADTALSLLAETHFTGSIRNANEGLRLFTNECHLVDEVPVSPRWPAGNNKSKQTMERLPADSWASSPYPGGSPREHSSGTLSEEDVENSGTNSQSSEEKQTPHVHAELQQEGATFHVTLTTNRLAQATHDVKVALETNGTTLSETKETENETWRSSLYYLPALFSGTSYDDTLHLRLRANHEQFSGEATLVVRIRESGKSQYKEYTQKVFIEPVPSTKKEKEPTEKTPDTPKEQKIELPKPRIHTSYPANITAGEPFTVTLKTEHFAKDIYDIKVSVEHERLLSRTLRDTTWTSSQFYIPAAFTGPASASLSLSLIVPTSTEPLPETAELLVRARKSGGTGFVYFQGIIHIAIPIPTIPEEPVEIEEAQEEPGDTEYDEGPGPVEAESVETPDACIDINTATREALDTLHGIGPALAERIISERESERGLFTSIDDLLRVSGIGVTTIENIRTQGTVCT